MRRVRKRPPRAPDGSWNPTSPPSFFADLPKTGLRRSGSAGAPERHRDAFAAVQDDAPGRRTVMSMPALHCTPRSPRRGRTGCKSRHGGVHSLTVPAHGPGFLHHRGSAGVPLPEARARQRNGRRRWTGGLPSGPRIPRHPVTRTREVRAGRFPGARPARRRASAMPQTCDRAAVLPPPGLARKGTLAKEMRPQALPMSAALEQW